MSKVLQGGASIVAGCNTALRVSCAYKGPTGIPILGNKVPSKRSGRSMQCAPDTVMPADIVTDWRQGMQKPLLWEVRNLHLRRFFGIDLMRIEV